MKLRNLLLGSICAATLALGGCEKGGSEKGGSEKAETKSVVYTPLKANITGDKPYPVDKAIRYTPTADDSAFSMMGPGFSLQKKTDKYTVSLSFSDGKYLSLKLYDKAKGTLSLSDYSVTLVDPKNRTDYKGVDVIRNSDWTECTTFQTPYCSESSLKKGNEIFLWGLNEMRFREHLWHFINSPSSAYRDPLDGWE